MGAADELRSGLDAFARRAWLKAHSHLSAAERERELSSDDLIRLGVSAYLIGEDAEGLETLARAHHAAVAAGDNAMAVRCAFWLFFLLINQGDEARAGGWFAQGQGLAATLEPECAEAGFMLIPPALMTMFGGDAAGALPQFDRAIEVADRCGDVDLRVIARLGRGHTLVFLGRVPEATAQLDEVMVAVTDPRVLPILTGLAYCAVISACHEAFDLRRASQWTEALTAWCATQPDLVPYRGQCLAHRAEILQLKGAWDDALGEAELARDQLIGAPDESAVGMAYYQLGELKRLRGDFAAAERAYRDANQRGRQPQPGLAKLRLAEGAVDAAATTIGRHVDEAQDAGSRAQLLPTLIEVSIATDDLDGARRGADELLRIAEEMGTPLLEALAASSLGAVLIAEDRAREAIVELRRGWALWKELGVPYEAARTRVLIGVACRALGDEDTAELELDAARWAFEQLGAGPDIERVESLLSPGQPSPSDGLTGREVEVLGLVATGKTNREIAGDLVISEKTVARHLSNIFVKIGVSSRAAATAYAYEHHLV